MASKVRVSRAQGSARLRELATWRVLFRATKTMSTRHCAQPCIFREKGLTDLEWVESLRTRGARGRMPICSSPISEGQGVDLLYSAHCTGAARIREMPEKETFVTLVQ